MIGTMMLASVLLLPDWLNDEYICKQFFDTTITTDSSSMTDSYEPAKQPELNHPKKPITIKLFDLNTERPKLSYGSFNTTYYYFRNKSKGSVSLMGEGKHNTPQGMTLERNVNKKGIEFLFLSFYSAFGFFDNVYSVESTFICNPSKNK
jgi:hypothetical protein